MNANCIYFTTSAVFLTEIKRAICGGLYIDELREVLYACGDTRGCGGASRGGRRARV